jgi:hypothetical protein
MAVDDNLNIRVLGDGRYEVVLSLETTDPELVLGAVQGLLAQHVVQSGTIQYAQESKAAAEAVQAQPPETPEARGASVRQQYTNLEKLNSFFYEGRVRQGDIWQPFGMSNWEEGYTAFCKDIPRDEAELIRGEYISERKAAENPEGEE